MANRNSTQKIDPEQVKTLSTKPQNEMEAELICNACLKELMAEFFILNSQLLPFCDSIGKRCSLTAIKVPQGILIKNTRPYL